MEVYRRIPRAGWPTSLVKSRSSVPPRDPFTKNKGEMSPVTIPEKVLSVPETHMHICGPTWIHTYTHKKISIEKIALPMAKAKCKRQQVWYPRRGEDANHVRSVYGHIYSDRHR